MKHRQTGTKATVRYSAWFIDIHFELLYKQGLIGTVDLISHYYRYQ